MTTAIRSVAEDSVEDRHTCLSFRRPRTGKSACPPRSRYPAPMKFETLAVHAGAEPDPATAALAPPIHLSTTFEHAPDGATLHGFMYIRDSNPTQSRLEASLAAIDSAAGALAFASGMAASSALLQSLPRGAHVLIPDDGYYAVRALASEYFPRWGVEHDLVAMDDLDAVRAAMRGIRSLAARMRVPSANARAVADFLAQHPAVEVVHYPALASHPGHEIAKRQMSDFGGMLSFRLRAGRDAAVALTGKLNVFKCATSLGGVESLIEHRGSSEGVRSTTPPKPPRVSVGLVDPGDLIAELR